MKESSKRKILKTAGEVINKLTNKPNIIRIAGKESGNIAKQALFIFEKMLETKAKNKGYPALVRAVILVAGEQLGIKISIEDVIEGNEYLDTNVALAKEAIVKKFAQI